MEYTTEDLCNLEEFVETERLQRIKMQEEKDKINKVTIQLLDYVIVGLILICLVTLVNEVI